MTFRGSLACIAFTVLFAGCSADTSTPETADQAAAVEPAGLVGSLESAEIDWFQGSIDEAFDTAKAEDKPLFLYWGAEWCPYCKELQATIFIRDEFIRLSPQFVMLDMSNGDSETIRYADEFRIYGLPTVIVFSPEGQELTRIRGGIDMEQYAAVLELTLNDVRPVAELVTAALAGESLSEADWALLSNYSWSQDRGLALGEESPTGVLMSLAEAAPEADALTRSRLTLGALGVWLREDEAERDATLGAIHLAAVEKVLADPALAGENLSALAGYGSDIVELAEGEQQVRLQGELLSLYEPAIADESQNLLNRAGLLAAWTEVATALLAEGESLPAQRIDWASAYAEQFVAALDGYQLHAGVNQLWGVYYDLGQEARARETLAIGIERSRTPFYFMSGMGYLERQAGNPTAALDWYRKAWEATRNPLDRTRWGRGYFNWLLKLDPENTAEVARTGSLLLGDMLSQQEGAVVYKRSFEAMGKGLGTWSAGNPEREQVLASLRDQMAAYCAELSQDEQGQEPCGSFLVDTSLSQG